MAGEWRIATVTQLQHDGILLVEDGNHGEYRPRPDEFVDRGVAFIRAADMDAGRVLFESAAKINERARQRITKGIGAPGDVLLSHKGTVGKVALVPGKAPAFVCSPQTTFWRTRDEQRLDRKYLYAFLRSSGFHAQLATRAGETDMAPYVSLTSQRGLSVTLPPIGIQRAIANILGTLDDKIELNRRMNETLEAIARALFKSWFVDFDPIRTKAEGRGPGLPKEIADLFPDRFEDSELGEIPAGWAVGTIDESTSLIIDYRGKTPKKLGREWSSSGIPAVSAKNIKKGRLVEKQSMNVIDRDLYDVWMKDKLAIDDILMTSEAPLGELLYLARDTELCLSQRVFALRAKRQRCTPSMLYFWLLSDDTQERLQSRATGSTVLGIRQSELRKIEVLLPPLAIGEAGHSFFEPCLKTIAANEAQNETLAALRDTLLPKLISGELRVTDTDRLLREATP